MILRRHPRSPDSAERALPRPTRGGQAAAALIVLAAVVLMVFLLASVYTIDPTEQAVLVQFGAPVGEPITEPGLHFRMPFVQEIRRFDKRLIAWDGDPNQIPTIEEQFISVDATGRWRIVDPLKFMQTVQNEQGAQNRLNDILDSVVRDKIASSSLAEIVRSKDWKVSQADLERAMAGEGEEETLLQKVVVGREELVRSILETAQKQVPEYGIELVDIRIKRLNYVDSVQQEVFERMIAERQRIAEEFRSEGQGRAAEIDGETDRLVAELKSEAEKEAEIVRGLADAEATKIYSEAYGSDPEFYAFFRTLESYSTALGRDVTMVIGADSDYFRYLRGGAEPPAGLPPPSDPAAAVEPAPEAAEEAAEEAAQPAAEEAAQPAVEQAEPAAEAAAPAAVETETEAAAPASAEAASEAAPATEEPSSQTPE